MDTRLNNIKETVNDSADDFYRHVRSVLGQEISGIVDKISRQTQVYVFSGIIRDFFLGRDDTRDVDLVLEDSIDIEKLIPSNRIIKNSFGGYKIAFDHITLDMWYLRDTWAFNFEKVFDFYYTIGIPETAFFNASAIAYNYNNRSFQFTRRFLRFLRSKELDVVYKPNPNYDLCIVNTLYYMHEYNLRLTKRLTKLIIELHNNRSHDYNAVQIKHFGNIKFNVSEIESRISQLESNIVSKRPTAGNHFQTLEFEFYTQ